VNGGITTRHESVDPVQTISPVTGDFQNAVRLAAQRCQAREQSYERRPVSLVERYVEKYRGRMGTEKVGVHRQTRVG